MAPKRNGNKSHSTATTTAVTVQHPKSSAGSGGGSATTKDHKTPPPSIAATATASGMSKEETDAIDRAVSDAKASLSESAYTHVDDHLRYKSGQPLSPHTPRLFIGALSAAQNVDWLVSAGITAILDVGSGVSKPVPLPKSVRHVLRYPGSMVDSEATDLRPIFDACHSFIDRALNETTPPPPPPPPPAGDSESTTKSDPDTKTASGGGGGGGAVLVHCYMGMSRSATVCISYLIRRFGLTMRQALDVVVTARPLVRPNDSFLRQLICYEREIINQPHTTAHDTTTAVSSGSGGSGGGGSGGGGGGGGGPKPAKNKPKKH